MAYLVGVDSFTDEKTYGYDSSGVNQIFRVQLGRNSFGKLSSFDTTDWYELDLDGPGSFNLIVSTDSSNNYFFNTWTSSSIGVKIEITDRNGNVLSGTQSAIARSSLDGNINFSYTGSYSHGDFYVKVSNLGFSNADYVLNLSTRTTLLDVTPPTVLSFMPTQSGTAVPINSDIILGFSEAIQRGIGSIVLKDAAGNIVANYDASSSSNLSISGSTLIIHPSAALSYGTTYSVSISGGSIKDLAGNSYAGTTGYSFSTIVNPVSVGANINGTAGNDYLTGTSGNDNISAGAGNDTIIGGAGNDNIAGGSGLDTLVLSGKGANYALTGTVGNFILKDNVGNDGTDNVTQVERLQFADVALAFDIDGVAGQAYRIYQAAFGRQPDLAGLGYWIKDMDKGSSLTTVAAGFFQSAEFKQLYGSNPSTTTLITNFYQNVLHRAPDQAGFDYWNNQLSKGLITPAGALASFCESTENQAQVIGQIQKGIAYIVWPA
jgi:Ca2+-binding RTX toxin-like protein